MITRGQARDLATADSENAISIYMPLRRAFDERSQNVIRLRNFLRDAEDAGAGEAAAQIRAAVSEDPLEGHSHAEGLAVFADASGARVVELPRAPTGAAHVQCGFRVAPLLPMLEADAAFRVIALDQESPTLYRADGSRLTVIEQDAMQRTMQRIRDETELPANVGHHSAGSAAGGRAAAKHHAQGESPDDYRKTQLELFARGVARTVEDLLKHDDAPLVAVGEPVILGLFRADCRHSALMEEGVAKSPAGLDADELRAEAAAVARRHFDRSRRKAAERLAERAGRDDGAALTDPELIAIAAEEGRVAEIVFARDDDALKIESAREDGADLADRILHAVLRHDGTVITAPSDLLPGGAVAGAVLRWPGGTT